MKKKNKKSIFRLMMVIQSIVIIILTAMMIMLLEHKVFRIPAIIIYIIGIVATIGLTYNLSIRVFRSLSSISMYIENLNTANFNKPIIEVETQEISEIIEDIEQLRDTLQVNINEQKQMEIKRKQFIARITHDLRTPLTSIIGYSEALIDGMVPDEKASLKTINSKAIYLEHLIEDLTVYSKEELGELPLFQKKMLSARLLENYFKNLPSLAPIKVIIKRPIINTYLKVDQFRFVQILDNLIGNASKYARSTIRIATAVQDDFFEISVKDDGCGIDEKYHHSIFDPFFMVNKKQDQSKHHGSGLGLTIVKQLVEQHGGYIKLESHVNEYTTFTFGLPIDM